MNMNELLQHRYIVSRVFEKTWRNTEMKKKIQFRFGVSEDSSRVHAGSVIAFALGNAQCPLKINKNFSLFLYISEHT